MKRAFKSLSFGGLRLLSNVRTSFFSNFFTMLGYTIKSEHLYNHCGAPEFVDGDRNKLHEYLSSEIVKPSEEIVFLEFGVLFGETFLIWVKNNRNPGSRFEGFDTFEGLPEDWGNIKKGSFSAGGKLPQANDSRARFHVGLIQDTLPVYARELDKSKRKVIHIDVDLYNASLITLIYLQPYLQKGDIIIFDDFFTLTKSDHEYKAFLDFLSLYKISYKPISKHRSGQFVIEVLG